MKYYFLLSSMSFCFILFFFTGCTTQEEQYDLMICNARVFDGKEYHRQPMTIFITDNQIIHVLPDSAVDESSVISMKKIDAKGNLVMPGLIEGHGHFLKYGESLQQLQLTDYNTWDEVIGAVEEKAATLPSGTWIEGRGWHQEKWDRPPPGAVGGYPRHDEMSSRIPDHPVFLRHASGHAAFANMRAMKEVGISRETNDPAGGRIIKNVRGNPTGIIEENAMEIFTNHLTQSKHSSSIWKQALLDAGQSCLQHGITSFQDAGSSVDEIKWLRSKADSAKLPVRLWVMAFDSVDRLNRAMEDLKVIGAGKNFFTMRSVKSYFDGALGSRGALLLEDYADEPGYHGQNTTSIDYLIKTSELCKKYDLQLCIHAIGDSANRATLDIFQQSLNGETNKRWRIEHAQHIDPADHSRFGKLGVIASVQPIHCTSDAPFVVDRLGQRRARTGAYVWKDLIKGGAKIAVGTDVPVESINPFENMYAAITRKSHGDEGAFYPDQKMTRIEVLTAYTSGNAYAAFEEDFKGQIAPDYLADIIILDTNLMECPDEDIPSTEVEMTILDGKVVYRQSDTVH